MAELSTEEQRTLPYVKGSETSRAAAKAMARQPKKLREQHLRMLRAYYHAASQGLTDAECQAATGLGGNSQRPRRLELARAKMIYSAGRRNGSAIWFAQWVKP